MWPFKTYLNGKIRTFISFFLDNPYKTGTNFRRIALPFFESDPEDVAENELKIRLSDKLYKLKDSVWYEYDFGDSWIHEITLKKILPYDAFKKNPVLLDGANAQPPEDCGGLGGYGNLLEVLADPKNSDHKDMLESLEIKKASEFDPKKFDKISVRFHDPKKYLKTFQDQF